MQTTNRIAIIGLGYWGQIIHKNLRDLGYISLATYDEFKPSASSVDSLDEIKADTIFVCVSSSEHYRICKYFLEQNNKKVFCEKPLTEDHNKSIELFKLANDHSSYLFVDWLFTYNNEVNYIKEQFFQKKKFGKILNVNMNRLNKGPERFDTNAMQDLASHDISILQHWFEQKPDTTNWISYRRNKNSIQDDSCIGLLKFGNVSVQLNCSWEHNIKDRNCILGFEAGILHWDDINQTIIANGEVVKLIQSSPLQNAIQSFILEDIPQEQIKKKTLAIEETLNETCLSIR